MQVLLTLAELLARRTNSWACPDCGQVWRDIRGSSLAMVAQKGFDPDCRHPRLRRSAA